MNAVRPWLLGVGGVALATVYATLIAVGDDISGELSLNLLQPIVQVAEKIGRFLLQNPPLWINWGVGVAAVILIASSAMLRRRRRHTADADLGPVLLALGLAFVAQLFIFRGWFAAGVIGYVGAVTVIVVASFLCRRSDAKVVSFGDAGPLGYSEAAAFLAIGIVAVLFRYYALNHLLDFFEGELSCYMAGATDFRGMLLANIGWNGPWAPMGILFYLPIWAMSAIAGSTVLAVRLGSAVIGVLTVVVVFVVLRSVMGRTVALWSAALLSIDALQVGWGRSDMHPHAATHWPGILLFGATIRALTTGATSWYVAVMLLMGLSFHQYPSGQFVVIVPVIAFAVYALQHRGFFKAYWRKGLLIIAGGGLWLTGYPAVHYLAIGEWVGPMDYVGHLGSRVLGGSDVVPYEGIPLVDLIMKVSRGIWDLTQGIFFEVPYLFFQTVIPSVDGMTIRSLPWFVAACAVVGLAICLVRIREPWSIPLLAMVVAGALPAVLSDAAWIKRASLLYLVLIIIAAIPLSIVTEGFGRMLNRTGRRAGGVLLVVGFALSSCIWVHLWFSGRNYSYGEPDEQVIADALEERIEPDTILIMTFWGDYIDGELVYLISEAFRQRQPVALYMTTHPSAEWQMLMSNPSRATDFIDPSHWYWAWLGLDGRIRDIKAQTQWSRVVYLIQHRPGVKEDIEYLAEQCPDLDVEGLFLGLDTEEKDGEILHRYYVWLASCDRHRDLARERFTVPAPQ
jgi:hypothetical protein